MSRRRNTTGAWIGRPGSPVLAVTHRKSIPRMTTDSERSVNWVTLGLPLPRDLRPWGSRGLGPTLKGRQEPREADMTVLVAYATGGRYGDYRDPEAVAAYARQISRRLVPA